jgi:Flp pilus assembly protein TadD
MDDAKKLYAKALEVDKENEYALANMGVINLK